MRVLITGSDGFVGKNLVARLTEIEHVVVIPFGRANSPDDLSELVKSADAVVHLAGENRPNDPAAFDEVNAGLTQKLCAAIRAAGRSVPILLASSTQATLDNAYGASKRAAEQAIEALATDTGNPAIIFRLPGIFGKWCRPNYNSVVATFCHNIARGLPISIQNTEAALRIVYIDDVVSTFIERLTSEAEGLSWGQVAPEYTITVGELAAQIRRFAASREDLVSERVGTGLCRALYATYVSHLPVSAFMYDVASHEDPRGTFVEMLKTPDCGQFSYFTAHPGVTRGGHYHHSKTEKFLVISGNARFRFRDIVTGEFHELTTCGQRPQIVETIPGWTHDITNVGPTEMIVMLWANEIFDRERPDTIARSL